jgi:predicted nuclease of predicted toxin-antitoxin system
LQLRILADEDVDYRIVKNLRENGFEVMSVLEGHRGASDRTVLNIAKERGALLLTEDKDFGEWVFAHKIKSVGIVFLRYKPEELEDIASTLRRLLLKYGSTLYERFAVVKVKKIRIRNLP